MIDADKAARARAARKRWNAKHPDKVRAYLRAWKLRYPEKVRAYERRRIGTRTRTDHDRSMVRLYGRTHRDIKNTIEHRRQARLNGAPGSHTVAEWRAKLAEHGGRCTYCGRTGRMTRDHVIPVSRGGTNDIGNIVPACLPCNSGKRDR